MSSPFLLQSTSVHLTCARVSLTVLAMIPFVVREDLTGQKLVDLWPLAQGAAPTLLE